MDNNNLARIRDEQVVQDYLVEFEEMFTGQRFGPGSLADTPYPVVEIAGAPAEVYFSPDDGVQKRLKTLLENAQESIYVLAYTFTADPLANTLIDRAADGVLVGMILEESRIEDSGADYRSFLAAGLDVRLDGNDGLMHHKVIIVDGQTVVFGSYNFTASANERNDENLLIVRNADLAGQFLAEYRRLAEDAR
jgi:phosphatidylserine/phosphatidylglycerophosphate/cardiolipin synthase-like enzyme